LISYAPFATDATANFARLSITPTQNKLNLGDPVHSISLQTCAQHQNAARCRHRRAACRAGEHPDFRLPRACTALLAAAPGKQVA